MTPKKLLALNSRHQFESSLALVLNQIDEKEFEERRIVFERKAQKLNVEYVGHVVEADEGRKEG